MIFLLFFSFFFFCGQNSLSTPPHHSHLDKQKGNVLITPSRSVPTERQ